jgi:hypothetical protein
VIPPQSEEKESPSSEVGIHSERKEREECIGPPPEAGGFDLSQLVVSPEEAGGDPPDGEQPHFLGDRLFVCSAASDSIDSHPLMVFQGSINGHQAVILLDQGANSNYVSKDFADRTGITQRQLNQPVQVTTATGRSHPITSQLMSTDVRVVGKHLKANLLIVPLGTYDVILGTPWYAAAQPKFDWKLWTCEGRSVYSKGGRSVGHPGRNARRLLSMAVGVKHQKTMTALATKYSDVFAKELPRRPVNIDALTHSFQMKDGVKPVRDGERRRSPEETRRMRDMVNEGIASGIIEDSKSEWCSQLLMVVKKDQEGNVTGERYCVDYRRVNELMKKDAHPLPLPEVMFGQLKGATIFSKMDLTKGFYQISLDPACREILAFSTPDGPKQWTVMPFGIANAPATFQREMQRIFRARLDQSVMVYIDDILIFSKDEDDHAEQVEWVLAQLRKNGYYANPDKCEFFQSQVNFLGHVIKAGGLAVQQHKVDSILQWPTPQCVKDVRSFIGLTTYYHRFVWKFAALAISLTNLTRKETPWVWGEKEQSAFDQLKQALASAPTLATPDNSKPYVVHTDASGFAVGATLSQRDEKGELRPVSFMSKKMSPAQVNYPVHEWELLAVVEALRAWRCYLYGSSVPIDIFTDHHSLTYLSTQPNLSPRQSRWVEQLQDYSFKVHHLAGDKNVVADALSRRSDYESAHLQEAEARVLSGLHDGATVRPRLHLEAAGLVSTSSDVASSSLLAPSFLDEIKVVARSDGVYYQPLLAAAEHLGLTVRDGLVYSSAGLLYIPLGGTLRADLLREVHDSPTGGHQGREKTYARLTGQVYWKGVYADVSEYVQSCVSCGQNKARNRTAADLLHPLPIPSRRWETITMDFVGPLPMTPSRHDFLLVVVDKFSKMVHLIPCAQTISAVAVAQLVYDHVVRLHGFPESIVSDRDSRFTSAFWNGLWKLSGTQLKMSTSYHPQTDGQTENVNRVVQDMLRAYVAEDRKDWDRHLTAVEIAINSSRHASTGFTPHFLNHNQEMRLPFSVAMKGAVPASNVPAAAAAMTEMATNDEAARSRMADAQARQKASADQHRRHETYAVLDQVMLSTANLTAYQHKLCCRFIGPFAVLAVGNGTVTLDLPDELRRSYPTINVDRVKRYTPSVGEWAGRQQHSQPMPADVGADGVPEWEVEAILGKKEDKEWRLDEQGKVIKKGGKVSVLRYLVAWLGFPAADCTWVKAVDMQGSADLVADYERRQAAETVGQSSTLMFCCVSGMGV